MLSSVRRYIPDRNDVISGKSISHASFSPEMTVHNAGSDILYCISYECEVGVWEEGGLSGKIKRKYFFIVMGIASSLQSFPSHFNSSKGAKIKFNSLRL